MRKKPFICQGCLTELPSGNTPHDYRDCSLASARAIMLKYIDAADRGVPIPVETYSEMKEWLDDSC